MRQKGFADNKIGMRHRNFRDRVEAFKAYGGFRCACCGQEEFSFLSLDHIDGSGNEDRKIRLGNKTQGGHHLYRNLKQETYPVGFQVLCMNCQVGKRDNFGICPHKLAGQKGPSADELLAEFEKLRIGSGHSESDLTVEYYDALRKLKRRTEAKKD
jgi:hypothetical protein